MSKKDCIMKGYDIEATNALLSNGMAEDIDDDVSSINLKKEEKEIIDMLNDGYGNWAF